MSEARSMGLALVAAFVGALACGPDVKEPEQSHRQFAEAWCRENIRLHEECGLNAPVDFPPEVEAQKQEECEADPAWDWTDECGDKKWAWNQCAHKASCDEFVYVGNALDKDDPTPCAEEFLEAFSLECRYSDSGTPIDHGG